MDDRNALHKLRRQILHLKRTVRIQYELESLVILSRNEIPVFLCKKITTMFFVKLPHAGHLLIADRRGKLVLVGGGI